MTSTDPKRLFGSLGLDPQALRAEPDFIRWRDMHPRLDVDGATLFVRGGDMLADEDQMLLDWLIRDGRVPEAALRDSEDEVQPEAGPGDSFFDVEGEAE